MQYVARLYGEIGQSIGWIALLHQLAQRCGRIFGSEQRPILAALDTFHEHVEFGLEPDRDALGRDGGAGVLVHERSAAGRQHLRPALKQARDHARLTGAELPLPADGEDIADGHASCLFDLRIGVDEGNAKAHRHAAAD